MILTAVLSFFSGVAATLVIASAIAPKSAAHHDE